MAAVLVEDIAEVRPKSKELVVVDKRQRDLISSAVGQETATEFGIWLSGLESFLSVGHRPFISPLDRDPGTDASREFRLVHSTLERCSLLNVRLLTLADDQDPCFTFDELGKLASVLRDATQLSDCVLNSDSLSVGEWNAWTNMLLHRLNSVPAFRSLIFSAETEGERYLPEKLVKLVTDSDHTELVAILPRFARVLKWLSVVGNMLESDEPLKPALLIFARVNEQIFELTTYINNRLERFPDPEAELFAQLDAASYTASLELKKVYSQELAGIASLRPSPSVFARMETAHSLLSDGFHQIIAGFARMIDPKTDVFKLFPSFQKKLEQSLVLRQELWGLAERVQAAEQSPEKRHIEPLQLSLVGFMEETACHLFYKDTETVERFVEEILVTKQKKDLVPILHRFGAYLEALFGQVNLRAVLEKHPFERQA